ncbi:MAG: phosphatase PAP2 family protein [Ferruginibacter sp.]
MGIRKKPILVLFIMICFASVKAQYTDSIAAENIYTSSGKLITRELSPQKIFFSHASFVIPAFMIAYGFSALKIDPLQDLNEEFREELWIEHSHNKVNIDNYLQFVPAAAVYGLNIAGVNGKNNLKDRSVIYFISNVFLNTIVSSLKSASKEQRPDGSSYKSFPSGHTTEAFASAEFLRQEYKDISAWYGIAGYATATATGLLRMYNNKHWLSDIVAGAGFGIISTKLAYWIYPAIKRVFLKNISTIPVLY